ncbi:MAG TPA: hypothetical protein DG942_03480 [Ruminococcaceae bacterium]|jgi:hypothetical protein|nr:hypothetical protein [Oscillospiraceae bacterium]
MDDLSSRLSEILNDPASMEKIKNFASTLTEGEKPEKPTPRRAQPQETESQPESASLDPDIMRSVMKIAPVISRARQEDSATHLLHALRPFLSEKRRVKLDRAVKLMQFTRVMPYLRNCGLF